jgi:hypothetical protein
MNTNHAIPDVFSWTHAWLPYVCSDCSCVRVVAMGDLPNRVTHKISLAQFHRKIGAALGWYLIKHDTDPTWICGTCYGHRVIDSVMQSRAGHWDLRRLVDKAADWRSSMLMIGDVR